MECVVEDAAGDEWALRTASQDCPLRPFPPRDASSVLALRTAHGCAMLFHDAPQLDMTAAPRPALQVPGRFWSGLVHHGTRAFTVSRVSVSAHTLAERVILHPILESPELCTLLLKWDVIKNYLCKVLTGTLLVNDSLIPLQWSSSDGTIMHNLVRITLPGAKHQQMCTVDESTQFCVKVGPQINYPVTLLSSIKTLQRSILDYLDLVGGCVGSSLFQGCAMIIGVSGAGKTTALVYFGCHLSPSYFGSQEKVETDEWVFFLTSIHAFVQNSSGCVFLLDNADSTFENAPTGMQRMNDIVSLGKLFPGKVLILASCSGLVNSKVAQYNVEKVFKISALTSKDKEDLFRSEFEESKEEPCFRDVSVGTDPRSFIHYLRSKAHLKTISSESFDSKEDFIDWSSIGGYSSQKRRLEALVKQWSTYDKAVPLCRGVLLHGPSGCDCLLKQFQSAKALPLSRSTILSKYLGESEKNVRDVFLKAATMRPCVLFFDEIDALGKKRKQGSADSDAVSQVQERVLATLLNELDGIDKDKNSGVFILAATNCKELVDSALIRPGRIDTQIELPLPSKADQLSILETCCQEVPLDPEVRMDCIQAAVPGGLGRCSELRRWVQEAAVSAVEEGSECVGLRHFNKR